jgi:hypothetical protein
LVELLARDPNRFAAPGRFSLTRLGQSPLSCSFHFIKFALRPYFSMSLRTL